MRKTKSGRIYEVAYAIVRVDLYLLLAEECVFQPEEVDRWGHVIRIKEVVTTLEEAEREVQRLNKLNADKECHYFWQYTHLFRDGASHGSNPDR